MADQCHHCDQEPERYGPHQVTGHFLYRCRDCNVEWWDTK